MACGKQVTPKVRPRTKLVVTVGKALERDLHERQHDGRDGDGSPTALRLGPVDEDLPLVHPDVLTRASTRQLRQTRSRAVHVGDAGTPLGVVDGAQDAPRLFPRVDGGSRLVV